ncbi:MULTISPECIES: RodZ family helix-turn-helix domain-containing protein [Listeria]|uniref:helix-turn-helix domain-containing protein n=1 Tax=Listeria TaxID=1637 RepID=UPI000B58E3DC|nr:MULTISPECIES: RodZ family helix-turn-helix domain-containing protein [Listeria]
MTDLGDKLKAARREKGLSLDDLQQITKIQKRYLVAIEEGNYSVMPGKFYTRAFIKQYAEAVDLDSAELFTEFESEVPYSQQEVVNQEQSRAQKKAAPLTTHSVGGSASTRNRFFDILPKVLIALFILFILFIIWYFVFANKSNDDQVTSTNDNQTVKVQDDTGSSTKKSTNSDDEAKKKEEEQKAADAKKKEEEAKKEEDKQVTITKGETQGNATTYTVANADKLTIELSASGGDSWVGVSTEAGANIYNGILKDGEKSEAIDGGENKTISIVVGNAPVTTVKINGETLELAPTLVKQVLTVTLQDNSDDSTNSSTTSN